MKKKKEEPTSIFKKKGFYAALYSCVGIVLVAAALITYYNDNRIPNGTPNELSQQDAEDSAPETALTSQSDVKSYMANLMPAPEEDSQNATVGTGITSPIYDDIEPDMHASAAVSGSVSASVDTPVSAPVAAEEAVKQPEPKTETVVYAEPIVEKPAEGFEITSAQDPELINAIASVEREDSQPVFNVFSSDRKMSWPLEGDIVMDYSMDKMVLDETLEQYRANSSISIQAPVGTQVKSAADGKVTSVKNSKEKGNEVVVDHGNGWVSTYSQLQDTILVKVGDVISEGQLIGGVASPSNHSILLGNHLEFSVYKDNEPTDPKTVLK